MTSATDPVTQSGAQPCHPQWDWQPLPRGARAEPLARAWLSTQLALEPDTLPLVRDVRGRPRLHAPADAWDANWSHSASGLLVACGRDVELGVDVEWSGRARPRAMDIAGRYFHPREADWLASLGERDRADAFLRLWCAKEAVLKAVGVGLVFGLHRLRFDPDLRLADCDADLGDADAWRIDSFAPAPGFVAALAWRPRAAARCAVTGHALSSDPLSSDPMSPR